MAVLDEVKRFLIINGFNSGYGSGDGNGYGSGDGDGYGYGDGNGYGYSNGNGYGYGYGDGSGDGSGDGNGYGNGNGNSNGYGYGYGDGSGDDSGIKEINGHTVYVIDNTRTIITSIRGNVAQGFILEYNTKLVPCYIVKENNHFAHGKTLHEAYASLQEKLYDGSTEEERIAAFKQKFSSYDTKYSNQDLFVYHHVLTGSCRMGRESFIKNKGISLDGKTTIREFVKLTEDSYGGKIIKKLPQAYGYNSL